MAALVVVGGGSGSTHAPPAAPSRVGAVRAPHRARSVPDERTKEERQQRTRVEQDAGARRTRASALAAARSGVAHVHAGRWK
eukprot:scaffold43890_cov42-Phaeocystis_antarctica.AAC.2